MVLDQIKEILKDTMDIDESKITLDAKLKEDLELDSLDSVELIMSAEEEFGIEIPDEDVMNFKTVNDIVTYIEEHK
ncbi:acyl carrier protein [Faecalibacillus intestinalis]|uniref:Acyl carrier protein n=1 Tax=Faecalibacillus intestinalis TaxID=1982626 RepID=A0A2T3G1X5_9FIRM|nr:acyl carrier protein [Faecalibacillus intestinalis]PST41502.1 acyl carrier protein [Faecalibacillus intestinalis]